MKFITALDALIHLLQVGFVRLSWWWCRCPLPWKRFSSTPDEGSSVETPGVKMQSCQCSAVMGASGLLSRARLCRPHGWHDCEILDTRVYTGLGLGRLGCQVWRQDHTWKVLLPAEGGISGGLWLLSAALHLEHFLALGTMERLTVALAYAPPAGSRAAPAAACETQALEGKVRGEVSGSFVFKARDEEALFCSHFRRGWASLCSLVCVCGFLPSFCSSRW